MEDDIRAEIAVLGQKLESGLEAVNAKLRDHDKAIAENRLAIVENGKAIARIEGKLTGGILIIGIAAGLVGPALMVIVNLVTG